MTNYRKTATTIGVLLSLLTLVACSPETPAPTATIDLDPFRTEVASTVLAQVTQTICPLPSDTPSPTPTVTTINIVTLTSTLPAGAFPVPSGTQGTGTPVVGTPVVGTPLTGTPAPILEDKGQWVSQTILDGTIFAPGEIFTMTWTLENVGASTWTASYLLRFYSGDPFGTIKEIPLGREVPPGQTVDISVLMTAPKSAGNYRSDWVMANQARSNFKEPIFLKIAVLAATATPSPTARPTATATASASP